MTDNRVDFYVSSVFGIHKTFIYFMTPGFSESAIKNNCLKLEIELDSMVIT